MRTCNPLLTPRMESVLRHMVSEAALDDPLTLFQPGGWMIGCDRVSGKICWTLIRMCLISSDTENWADEEVSYWHANEEARRILDDPAFVPTMVRIQRTGIFAERSAEGQSQTGSERENDAEKEDLGEKRPGG